MPVQWPITFLCARVCACVRARESERKGGSERECCIACKSEWSPAAAPAEVTQDKSPPLRSAVISWINTHLSPSPCSRLRIHLSHFHILLLYRNQQTSQVYSSADSFTDTDHTMYTNGVIFWWDCSNDVKREDTWGFCTRCSGCFLNFPVVRLVFPAKPK